MRILVAPDSFKGSVTAFEATQALVAGLIEGAAHIEVVQCPLGDGGEGTARVVAGHLAGRSMMVPAHGPLGAPLMAELFWLPDATVIVDMAVAGGYALIDPSQRDIERTSTFGCGEVLEAARRQGARRILMGLGGSITLDAGLGALAALGAVFLDGNGRVLEPRPRHLGKIARVELSGLHPDWRQIELQFLFDTRNPLLGPHGAALFFAPYKGANPEQCLQFEQRLEHFAQVLSAAAGREVGGILGGSGSGGMGLSFHALLGAALRPGADYVFEVVGLERLLPEVDLVLTGEGRLDQSTLFGKLPMALAERATAWARPTLAIVGEVGMAAEEVRATGLRAAFSLVNGSMAPAQAQQQTKDLLRRKAAQLARLLAVRVGA